MLIDGHGRQQGFMKNEAAGAGIKGVYEIGASCTLEKRHTSDFSRGTVASPALTRQALPRRLRSRRGTLRKGVVLPTTPR